MSLVIAVVAGALIGLSLGALGGGGAILAVPVLVHLLGQAPAAATTGSLVVVGVTAVIGAIAGLRAGQVRLGHGLAFGAVAIGGAVLGARLSLRVPPDLLMACFASLMALVGGVMAWRLASSGRRGSHGQHRRAGGRPQLDDPIIAFRDGFMCDCPRALKVLVTATVVGLVTGFLGVGGGFLVVPALVLALALPMHQAVGTALVVIAVTSATALATRAGAGVAPEWGVVAMLTATSALAAALAARWTARLDSHRLQGAFVVVLLAVALYTAASAVSSYV